MWMRRKVVWKMMRKREEELAQLSIPPVKLNLIGNETNLVADRTRTKRLKYVLSYFPGK